jgi:hypothetical protein
MSETTIRGIVHLIEPTKTFGQKGFRKRVVVLEQPGRYPNYIPLEFIGDACETADQLQLGDEIEARYRLNGRKWQKDSASEVKYFLSAEAMSYKKTADRPSGEKLDVNSGFSEAAYSDEDAPF